MTLAPPAAPDPSVGGAAVMVRDSGSGGGTWGVAMAAGCVGCSGMGTVDLDIETFDGRDYDEVLEDTVGGFVALNNDNDNYNFGTSGGGTEGPPIIDKDESGPIDGENDLIPLKLHARTDPAPEESFTLGWTSNVRLWLDPDKSTPVEATTNAFPANVDTIVYVEGIAPSTAEADTRVVMEDPALSDCDEVRLTVYTVTGPTNVPGYSKYTYKADLPDGRVGNWTATGGNVVSGATTNTAEILWGGGPVVGKAIFSPTPDFKCEREVNVVQVTPATGGVDYDKTPKQSIAVPMTINSTEAFPAMDANLTVGTIAGPTVGGKMRGVKFIDMGFIQNSQFTAKHGDFDGFTPKKRRVSSLEDGMLHLDTVRGSTVPWYNDQTDQNQPVGPDGYFKSAIDPVAAINNQTFHVSDRPEVAATDTMVLTIGATTDGVDRFAILDDFDLFFCVHTTEAVNESETIYTIRAKAHWRFDGSGNVDADGKWTLTGTGNTGDMTFTGITTGDRPASLKDPVNDLYMSETWSTKDQ